MRLPEQGVAVETIDTAPGIKQVGWWKYLTRLRRAGSGATKMLFLIVSGTRPVVYLSGEAGLGMALLLPFILLARLAKLSLVIHHHNFSYVERKSSLASVVTRLLGKDALHVFLCDDMCSKFRNVYKSLNFRSETMSNAIFIVPPGDAPAPAARSRDIINIGMLSNLTFEKGVDTFIDVLRALQRAGVRFDATLAGPCVDEEVACAIEGAQHEFGTAFRWIGSVMGDRKESFFTQIDVFIFPTRYKAEAQPLVLLEALSHGCPILTTDAACIGCDHDDSPGGVFKPEEFVARAVDWLSVYSSDLCGRAPLTSAALRRFGKLRETAQLQFMKIVTIIRS